MLLLLLICRTNLLSGNHMNNYYQQCLYYGCSRWRKQELFDGLPPSSCWQPIRQFNESYLAYFGHDACIRDPIWIETQGLFWDAILSTLDHYAHCMRTATKNRCIYANTPELYLIARSHSLNIAVYQVDPCSSQQYVLIQEFVGDPMLPTAPLFPFFSLRFAHSWSSLRVIFSVKSSSLEVFEQLSFLMFSSSI